MAKISQSGTEHPLKRKLPMAIALVAALAIARCQPRSTPTAIQTDTGMREVPTEVEEATPEEPTEQPTEEPVKESSFPAISANNVDQLEQVMTLSGHKGKARDLAFSPDGKQLASGSDDESVITWDMATGDALQTLSSESWVSAVGWSPDGDILAAGVGASGILVLWDVQTGEVVKSWNTSPENDEPSDVTGIAFLPDGSRVVTGVFWDRAPVWDLATGEQLADVDGFVNMVLALDLAPDGQVVALATATNVVEMDVNTGRRLRELALPPGEGFGVEGIDYSANGERLAAVVQGASHIVIWDAVTGRLLQTLPEPAGLRDIVLSNDGTVAAVATLDDGVILWDTEAGSQMRRLSHPGGVLHLALSPDGSMLACGLENGNIIVWTLQ